MITDLVPLFSSLLLTSLDPSPYYIIYQSLIPIFTLIASLLVILVKRRQWFIRYHRGSIINHHHWHICYQNVLIRIILFCFPYLVRVFLLHVRERTSITGNIVNNLIVSRRSFDRDLYYITSDRAV